jgi:DNA-binding response OmpR family regulator
MFPGNDGWSVIIMKRILIIEDDRQIALALSLRLRHAGYEIAIAYDGVAGANAAVEWRPDLVLLDISMPDDNGFVVAERIQALLKLPKPIIFLTASQQPSFRRRAEALGAAGYFEKPYETNLLLAAIGDALRRFSPQICESDISA